MDQERYAIVGYGFRMPGGIATADHFWQLLSEREFVREPVADRYGPGYEPVGGEPGPGRFGSGYEGLMRGDEPYLFDCRLFGMSAREASVMDPQLRMLLTCTWEAFERAGWDHARLRDNGLATHVVCADISQLPGDVGHPDFMRTGRWMRGAAALFGGDRDGTGEGGLTAEMIVGELCREISRLSGHERVGPREAIASFGVNSVSIAELSAFLRTRFGHHVGILDLMTTATPESVANAIISSKAPQGVGHGLGAADESGVSLLRSGEIETAASADASLPAQCQEDLEFLQRTVRELTSAAHAAPAVSADRFAAVFLTGATGFVGRFVLAELLRQSDSLVVHCLVRADSPDRGLARIREGMETAEIWDDSFAARIRVWSQDRPIGVRSVTAELGTVGPEWPGLITTTARSLSWISRHAGEWPYQRPPVPLDARALRRRAREFASRLDVSFDGTYPPELLEGLDRLVAALREPAARIRDDRHAAISFDLGRKLWNRASLAAEFARHPEIARERVDRPVFILGINRTGTTLLHRLLARGTRFWAPYPEEIVHPALPEGASAGVGGHQ